MYEVLEKRRGFAVVRDGVVIAEAESRAIAEGAAERLNVVCGRYGDRLAVMRDGVISAHKPTWAGVRVG